MFAVGLATAVSVVDATVAAGSPESVAIGGNTMTATAAMAAAAANPPQNAGACFGRRAAKWLSHQRTDQLVALDYAQVIVFERFQLAAERILGEFSVDHARYFLVHFITPHGARLVHKI